MTDIRNIIASLDSPVLRAARDITTRGELLTGSSLLGLNTAKLYETSRLASEALASSSLLGSNAAKLFETSRLASAALASSSLLGSNVAKLYETSRLASEALASSSLLGSNAAKLYETSRLASAALASPSLLDSNAAKLFETSRVASETLSSAALNSLRLGEFDLNGLLSLKNVPKNISIDYEWLEKFSQYSQEEADELYQEVSKEIIETHDYDLLSDEYQALVIYLFVYIGALFYDISQGQSYDILPTEAKSALLDIAVFCWTQVSNIIAGFVAADLHARLTNEKTVFLGKNKVEIKALLRKKAVSHLERSLFKGYRVVVFDAEPLRYIGEDGENFKPSNKLEIIETLPIGTILRVLDKCNRTWIKVAVEIEDEEEVGWVLRSHTTYLK